MPFSDCHLFFDLDRTLWDFDKNSEIALRQIFIAEDLEAQVGGFAHFHKQYVYQNAHLWKLYGKGIIQKDDLRNVFGSRSSILKYKMKHWSGVYPTLM